MIVNGNKEIYEKAAVKRASKLLIGTAGLGYLDKDNKFSQKDLMEDYLGRIINLWIVFNEDEKNASFTIKDILGETKDWKNTPMQYLFNYYYKCLKDRKKAQTEATIAAACLLKEVIVKDEFNKYNLKKCDSHLNRYFYKGR